MKLSIPKYFKRRHLKISGIYFLLNKGKIVYIGRTTNLFGRLNQGDHLNKTYDYVRIIPCKRKDLKKYERRWIIRFRPKYNFVHIFVKAGIGWTKKKPINLRNAA